MSPEFVQACSAAHLAAVERLRGKPLRVPFRVPSRPAVSQVLAAP